MAVFSPAIDYDFVNFDDDLYVYENPAVMQGLGGSGLEYALTSHDVGTWAPLTWLSYELDTTLLGARPSSYHLTNILLHAAAGALLFAALSLMLKSLWTGALVSAVFLLHPLRVESVVWIAERKDVLCAFFWMLGLLAYAWYARRPNLNRWGLLCLCFAAGLISKMMMVTFPFVLLLLDFWPLNRFSFDRSSFRQHAWPLLREKIPLWILSILAVWLSSRALQSVHTLAPVGEDIPAKLLRLPENYLFYIQKIFWPVGLSVLHPIEAPHLAMNVFALIFLAAVSVLVLGHWRSLPFLLVGWFWFLGALVPVIGFVRFSDFVVADRYTYIPSIGLTLALAAGLDIWTKHFPVWRRFIPVAAAATCIALTFFHLPVWRNSFTLYDAALRSGPHHVAYNNRGMAFYARGDSKNAFEDFTRAIALNPGFARAWSNRGSLLNDLGRFDQAIDDCNHAIECDPQMASAYNNRGNARAGAGDLVNSLVDYDKSIELSATMPSYFNNRAAAYFRLGRIPEAKADIQKCQALGGHPHPALVEALAAVQDVQAEIRVVVTQPLQNAPKSQLDAAAPAQQPDRVARK